LGKPAEQLEAERVAADFIAQRIENPLELAPVASALSSSIGAPEKPVKANVDTPTAAGIVRSQLLEGISEEQEARDKLNKALSKYGGMDIEGTGIDLGGPGFLLGLLALGALTIFVPGFASLLIYVLKRIFDTWRGTTKQIVQAVEEYKVKHPEEGEKLKLYLSQVMDSGSKEIVRKIRQKELNSERLTEKEPTP
jgi:hypothetical protein